MGSGGCWNSVVEVFFGKKGRSQMTTSSEALSEKHMGVEVLG